MANVIGENTIKANIVGGGTPISANIISNSNVINANPITYNYATTTKAGIIRIATDEEASQGVLRDVVITPYTLLVGLNSKQNIISDLPTIRNNASKGANAYSTISNYGNIVTHNVSEFATSAEGTLANTALQPNDNITELVNNAGYITSSSLPTKLSDLTDDLGTDPVHSHSQYLTEHQDISGKANISDLSTVAFSGNYTDLLNQPTIPSAQVNSDWNATSGVAQILNKPTIPTVGDAEIEIQTNNTRLDSFTTNQSGNKKTINIPIPTKLSELNNDTSFISSVSWNDVNNKPSTFTPSYHEHVSSEITDLSTTIASAISGKADIATSLSGYGIIDAYTKAEIDGMVSAGMHYKGTKSSVSALPSTGNQIGDLWNVEDTGANYAWNGTSWDKLSENIDLSGYVPTSRTVNGKALSGDISLNASDVGALPSSTVIPTVNNSTITIQKNGTDVQSFTLNQSNGATINITVPTDTNDLTNGAGFITSADLPTVDQVYDGTSANAQSGVAIAGAGFVENTATNTKSLTIIGNSTAKAYSINIGNNSSSNNTYCLAIGASSVSGSTTAGEYCTAIGAVSRATSTYSTALGYNSWANGTDNIQIGYGTNNVDHTLSIGFYNNGSNRANYKLLDGATGVIPDDRISSNIARTSAIPTDTSDLTNGAGYITGITSADVTTALGYTPVNKAGDTMSNMLTINKDNSTLLKLQGSSIGVLTVHNTTDYSTATSSGTCHSDILFHDYTNVRRNTIRSHYTYDNTGTLTASKIVIGTNKFDGSAPQGLNIVYDGTNGYIQSDFTPAATNSTSSSRIPTCGWVNDATKSTNVVHRTNSETIAGAKTFTDDMTINKSNPNFIVKDSRIDFTTNPSSNIFSVFSALKDVNNVSVGEVWHEYKTDGSHSIYLQSRKSATDNTTYSILKAGWDANGNAYSSFPNTTCVDGQWVASVSTLASGVNLPTTDNLSYDLSSYLPADANTYQYEVMLSGVIYTGATSGNQSILRVGGEVNGLVCQAIARSNASYRASGTITVATPASHSNIIRVFADSGNTGTFNLSVRGYRRIGTNT